MIGYTRVFLLVFAPGEAWNMVVSGLHAIWWWSLAWILTSLVVVLGVVLLVSSTKLKRRAGAMSRRSPDAGGKPASRRAAPRGRRFRWTAVAIVALLAASIAAAFLTTSVEDSAAEVQPSLQRALSPSHDIWTALSRVR